MKKGAAVVVLVSVLGILLSYKLIPISAQSRLEQLSQPEQEEMAPDEFFVSFKEEMTDASMQEMRSQGMAVRHRFEKIRTISIKTANPNLTNTAVEDLLFSTCIDLGPSGFDQNYGYGLVNASAAVARAEASR